MDETFQELKIWSVSWDDMKTHFVGILESFISSGVKKQNNKQ
jgi:hypothetical protein